MSTTTASIYDPSLGGINGNPAATPCGIPVSRMPWSVAHRTARCGTLVIIENKKTKASVETVIADRGPYVSGRNLDLRPQVAAALGITGLGEVDYELSLHIIDLKDYANKGGTAEALKSITGRDAGTFKPNNTIGDKVVDNVPGLKPLTDVAGAAYDATAGIGDLIGALFQPSTYLRLGKGLLGGFLIFLGTAALVFVVANGIRNSSPVKNASGII